MKYIILLINILTTSCTISITLTDTHGKSEDVVDAAASTDVEADPNLTLPIS